ncbi:hypothetical protein [Microbacterium oleivorans]|uniref:Carboxypeptidase regulatory-like domain-containing protein n=1 Tax=Microbacterium oleivorans TaxID=273677 RepID=A0A4R5YC18_9MICO|nr:hypothetical protein [Microbacterium oleivorans]TDL42244.1 hypothetical protein E2R54_14810 [Microbacterium oleivorans]
MGASLRRRSVALAAGAALLTGTIWALPQAAIAEDANPTGVISGKVTGDQVAEGYGYASAWLDTGSQYDVYYGEITPNGDYRIEGLPAGTYRVGFNELGIDDVEYGVTSWTEWWNDALTLDDGTGVVVGDGLVAGIDANVDSVRGVASDPVISGSPVVGNKLTVSRGAWPAGTEVQYAWYANYSLLSFGPASSITLGAETLGKRITVEAYGDIDATGYPSADEVQIKISKDSAPVKAAALQASTPSVSGTAAVGATLTAKAGTWAKGASLSYQWYASGKKINGATKSTYKISSSLVGKNITVTVTGKKAGHVTTSKGSKATAKVALSATPTISGSAKVGQKLTAKPGRWTSGTRLSYQWYANGKAISKATKSTFTVPSNLKGKKITVKVTGTKSGYATVSTTSRATGAVAAKSTAKPAGSQVAKPSSKTSCPKSHPIKGNQTTRHTKDWIYHVPGGQYYNATHPEQCFATAAAAQKAGYRASKR